MFYAWFLTLFHNWWSPTIVNTVYQYIFVMWWHFNICIEIYSLVLIGMNVSVADVIIWHLHDSGITPVLLSHDFLITCTKVIYCAYINDLLFIQKTANIEEILLSIYIWISYFIYFFATRLVFLFTIKFFAKLYLSIIPLLNCNSGPHLTSLGQKKWAVHKSGEWVAPK
jgi:hypothetical protein